MGNRIRIGKDSIRHSPYHQRNNCSTVYSLDGDVGDAIDQDYGFGPAPASRDYGFGLGPGLVHFSQDYRFGAARVLY